MTMDTHTLLDALNSVITIPVVPFKNGSIDYDGHAKNIRYLMNTNVLSAGRPRVIAIAGTSPIHHIDHAEQTRLIDATGKTMGSRGVLMSGIVPNPIGMAGQLIEAQSRLERSPDVYLIMPLGGVYDPNGVYETYMAFAEKYGQAYGARFLYYFRQNRDMEAVIRLLNDSPYFIGVKVGTSEDDVKPLVDGVGNNAMVIWGIGDRCTRAAELGAKGHTSGISVLVAKAGDSINNAQRAGDYETSRRVEAEISALEELRFMNGRQYNYSAVVEALNQSGFDDIVGGEGAPFNPPVPPEISAKVVEAIAGIKKYH